MAHFAAFFAEFGQKTDPKPYFSLVFTKTSMKQTNNAIKFLMAQYRAIFKSAYFKGLAAAAVVTLGLAAGAAQANTGYLLKSGDDKAWDLVNTSKTSIENDNILAGSIAGNNLDPFSTNLTEEQQAVITGSGLATGGDVVIGKYSYNANNPMFGTGYMNSGEVAGGWATTSGSMAANASENKVTVNGTGFVKGDQTNHRGVIYGGRAKNETGYAYADGNRILVTKDDNQAARNTEAAKNAIRAGRAEGLSGATANNNYVEISGSIANRQKVAVGSGTGFVGLAGGIATVTSEQAIGTYEASNNELILNAINATNQSQALNFVAGQSSLSMTKKSASGASAGIADNNYIELNDSIINVKGGTLYANQIEGASGATTSSSIDAKNRGISITNSAITTADSTELKFVVNKITATGTGSTEAKNGVLNIADTKATGGKSILFAAADVETKSTSTTVSNNVVNITESDAEEKRTLTANVTGAAITNSNNTALSISATGNAVTIGTDVKLTGDVTGLSVSASGDKITTLNATGNSVSVAGEVAGNIQAVSFTQQGGGKIDTTKNKLSFLNNDVNLLAGAEVSVGDLIGGEGKDSVITIADGSKYVVNTLDSSNTQSILSDVINIDGSIEVNSGKYLHIAGFTEDGTTEGTSKHNKNLTTVGSTAEIHNKGTINVFGKVVVEQGATLTAETAGAGIFVDGKTDTDGKSTLHSDKNLKENAVEGAGYGTLVISSGQLESYLTKDIVLDNEREDAAGGVVLTSGARLEFSDATDLYDFKFTKGSGAVAGVIAVNDSGSQNVINGHDITISKALVGTNNAPVGDMNLHVSVDNLTLGDGTDTGLKNLSGSGVKKLTIRDGLTVNVANNGYFTFDGATEALDFTNSDTTTTSQVNGNLEFTSTDRTDISGLWDFNDNLKFSAGSSSNALAIGRNNKGSKTYDTYVTFKGELINNLGAANGATILVKDYIVENWKPATGSVVYKYSKHTATLDLTQATLSETSNAGLITLQAGMNGTVKMTGAQLEDILTDNKTVGYALGAEDNGVIYVNSSITGEHNFSKFQDRPDGKDGALFANKVTFGEGSVADGRGGILDINGDLSLYTGKNADGSAASSGSALDIGTGTIKADIITLTNYAKDKNGKALDTTVAAGTLEVSEGLVVRNSEKLILGDGTQIANVVLDSDSYSLGGSVSVKNLDIKADSSLQVKTGTWSSEGDIYTTGANGFVVGYAYKDQATTDEDKAANKFLSDAKEQGLLVAQFTGDNFNATSAGDVITVHDASKATFNTMQLADGSVVNLDGGHLLVNGLTVTKAQDAAKTDTNPAYVNLDNKTYGTSLTAGIDFGTATVKVHGAGAVMEFGNVATNALVDLDGDANDADKDGSKIAITEGGIDQAQFHVDNFGQLKFNFDEGTALSTADIDALLAGFKMTDTTSNGYLNLGNADLGLAFETRDDGNTQISWDNLADYVNVIGSQATTDKLMSSLVYGIPAANQVKGHYGALAVNVSTGGTTQVGVNGPLSLHNAAAFGNYFVVNSNTGKELGVKLGNGASLGLVNGGVIGSITGSGQAMAGSQNDVTIYNEDGVSAVTTINSTVDNQGIVGVDTLKVQSATEVKGNVEVETLELESTLTSLGEKDTVHVNGGYITDNAALTTYGFEIGNANNNSNDNTDGYGNVVVLGSLTATNNITMHTAGELGVFDGTVSTADLTMEKGGKLYVGYDPDSFVTNDDESTIVADNKSYSGEFEATGVTTLNGGYVFVDPIYGQNTALVSLDDLKGATAESDKTLVAGTLDGSAFVGQNAALGIGSANLATLKDKIARFQHNGSLNGDEVGSVLYVGKAFTLGADQGITLTAQSHEDFLKYYNTNNSAGAADFTEFSVNSNGVHIDGDYPVLDNTLFLGANTAILVDAGVASNADTSRTNPTAVITFAGTNNTGSVIADGGDIVIDGDVRASTYQVFSNATISYLDGTAYAIVEDKTAAHYDDNINVATENDFLQGVVDTNGQVTLGVNPNGRAIMHGASDPVYATLVAYARGYNGEPTKDEAGNEVIADSQKLYNGYVDTTNEAGETVKTPDYGNYSNYFLQETISTGNGSAAEAVARLAVFGGAAQAAISAGASTYDAVSGRMGVGANGANITVADNTQGAALWLAPIYKSSDSDGFDAEGVDYGVDMDLYGVALGADYTLSNGIRFGAMFNVGSGDVDGQGAGSAVSNDFDYYGFAVYGGYSMGALSLVADVSYTVADNDLEGNTAIDKVGASLDSTNLSIGVTGQYQLDFNGTTVTPHAGLRFSRIDLDDYTVDGEDIIADYDADSMNIFSIPVGVTFAKEFTGDAWTVKPSLDLTLTGNFGDDETDGTVHWAGIENLSTNVSSEVIDNFTYGATLGVAAKTGNFSLGLGVNYTGSSNVDEFGVNANARFVF